MDIRFKKNGITTRLSRPDSISAAIEQGDIQSDTQVLIESGEVEIFSGKAGGFPLLEALIRSQGKVVSAEQTDVKVASDPKEDAAEIKQNPDLTVASNSEPLESELEAAEPATNVKNTPIPDTKDRSLLSISMPTLVGAVLLILMAYMAMATYDNPGGIDGDGAAVREVDNTVSDYVTNAPPGEAEEYTSFDKNGEYSALPAPAAVDLAASNRVPTVAEYNDQMVSAARELKRVMTDSGMLGASMYSRECWGVALNSDDILKTDFCAAFDFAAIAMDDGAAQSMGVPRNDYFLGQQRALKSVYARFTQASPRRAELTDNFAVAALVELYEQ